jgi:hypothetical protein
MEALPPHPVDNLAYKSGESWKPWPGWKHASVLSVGAANADMTHITALRSFNKLVHSPLPQDDIHLLA